MNTILSSIFITIKTSNIFCLSSDILWGEDWIIHSLLCKLFSSDVFVPEKKLLHTLSLYDTVERTLFTAVFTFSSSLVWTCLYVSCKGHTLTCRTKTNQSFWLCTYSPRSWIWDAAFVLHPAIVRTFFMGKRSVESCTDGRHGVDTHCWTMKDGAVGERVCVLVTTERCSQKGGGPEGQRVWRGTVKARE